MELTVFSNELEPTYLAVLNFVKDHPQDRQTLAYCFMLLYQCEELGPYEIIEYCMRELRWQEVHDYLAGIASVTSDINWRAVAKRLLDVYYDPWPSGVIYSRYAPTDVDKLIRSSAPLKGPTSAVTIINEFWQLCEIAHELAQITPFSNEREPSFVPILNFVKDHPQDRQALAYCFMILFHCPDLGPYEIIEYCMRELRWQEVHEYLAGVALVTPDINWRAVAKRLLEAYYDPWPSAGSMIVILFPNASKR